MKHQYVDSGDKGCSCKVRRRSLFGLIHFQSGVHTAGCPKSTWIDKMMRAPSFD